MLHAFVMSLDVILFGVIPDVKTVYRHGSTSHQWIACSLTTLTLFHSIQFHLFFFPCSL
uniref:Uncharacterized protein n=1 Tax=Anguilla anguilla TaxID=7936 RepID=A0A0E9VH81_ANGAN